MTKIHRILAAPQVQILWLPIAKFQSVRIEFNFLAPQRYAQTTQRRLLINLLQRSNHFLHTAAQFNRQLANLYGTELTGQSIIYQNLNILSLALTVPVAHHLPALVPAAIDLLLQTLTAPNIDSKQEQFVDNAWQLETTNLAHAYASLQDNYSLLAELAMKKILYQSNTDLNIPDFGVAEQLTALTSMQTCSYYQKVIAQEPLIVTVVGDLPATVVDDLAQRCQVFAYQAQAIHLQKQALLSLPTQPVAQSDQLAIQQSQLVIAYRLPDDTSWPVSQVLNMMLGGDDQALLFQQVRERQSLAYSIYSNYNFYEHFLTIQAGVDAQQITAVQNLVAAQIEHLATQNLSDLLQHAKQTLISEHLLASDRLAVHAHRLLLKNLNPAMIVTDDQYQQKINQVTLKQVQAVAGQSQLLATYTLIGES